jgi:hypothetical protein
MKLPRRRQFLHLAAGAAALPAVSRIARAQAYPSRPVRLIVGYPPGTTPDILARVMSPLNVRFAPEVTELSWWRRDDPDEYRGWRKIHSRTALA